MLERLDELAGRRVSFAFETTLAGRAYARRISELLANGYRFHVVFLWLDSPELALARVKYRVRAGGHAIPEDVVRRRYRSGIRNFFHLYRPLTTRWQVYGNSSEEAGRPRLIAFGSGESTDGVMNTEAWSRVERQAGHEP